MLRGRAQYVDDIDPDGLLHIAFVRSQHAREILIEGPGVITAADLAGRVRPVPLITPPGSRSPTPPIPSWPTARSATSGSRSPPSSRRRVPKPRTRSSRWSSTTSRSRASVSAGTRRPATSRPPSRAPRTSSAPATSSRARSPRRSSRAAAWRRGTARVAVEGTVRDPDRPRAGRPHALDRPPEVDPHHAGRHAARSGAGLPAPEAVVAAVAAPTPAARSSGSRRAATTSPPTRGVDRGRGRAGALRRRPDARHPRRAAGRRHRRVSAAGDRGAAAHDGHVDDRRPATSRPPTSRSSAPAATGCRPA